MRKRSKLPLGRKLWLVVLIAAMVVGVAYIAFAGNWVNPFSKKLEVHISIPSATISKDKFLVVDGELRNHTDHAHGAPWGTCAQKIAYFMDDKKIYSEGDGPICLIGYGAIEPGKVLRETFTIDPTAFSDGPHSFYILYDDNIRSNTINLTFTSPTFTGSCYDVTEYASPLCSQIEIQANIADSEDKARCVRYLDYLSKDTPLRPIAPLSSIDCIEKGYAIPYLVVNLPKNDPDQWIAKLLNHFNTTNPPNEYTDVRLVQYP